jgi:hypothetical protein
MHLSAKQGCWQAVEKVRPRRSRKDTAALLSRRRSQARRALFGPRARPKREAPSSSPRGRRVLARRGGWMRVRMTDFLISLQALMTCKIVCRIL